MSRESTTPTAAPPPPEPVHSKTPYDNPVLRIPAGALTHEGFREWAVSDDFPEFGRLAWIQGELWIDMSPADIDIHNQLKLEVAHVLHGLCREHDLGIIYGDDSLVSHDAAGVSNEPDATFVSWEAFETGRVRKRPMKERPNRSKELIGSPDMVLEVVSDSSVKKDHELLRHAYHDAGIREYWLIDTLGREDRFEILRHGREAYESVPAREGWMHSEVFSRHFRLDRERDRLGGWRYTLHVR